MKNKEFNQSEKQILFDYYTSIGRFYSGKKKGLIAYLNKNISSIEQYPIIKKQLKPYDSQLKNRREVKNGRIKWFHLHWPRDQKYFSKEPKIISAIRTDRPSCFYTEEEYYGSRAMNFIKTDRINLKFLTSLLNSRLSYFWLKHKGKQLGDLLQIDKVPLLGIPLINPSEKEQTEIAKLAQLMLDLQKEAQEITENTDKHNRLKIEIEKLDAKIDRAIYKLYDLTDEEINCLNKDF